MVEDKVWCRAVVLVLVLQVIVRVNVQTMAARISRCRPIRNRPQVRQAAIAETTGLIAALDLEIISRATANY